MYLEKNESTGGGRGWHYSTRLSQIEEKLGRQGWDCLQIDNTRELFAIRQERMSPLFDVWWSGRGSVAYL
jgi:hypothetical protein